MRRECDKVSEMNVHSSPHRMLSLFPPSEGCCVTFTHTAHILLQIQEVGHLIRNSLAYSCDVGSLYALATSPNLFLNPSFLHAVAVSEVLWSIPNYSQPKTYRDKYYSSVFFYGRHKWSVSNPAFTNEILYLYADYIFCFASSFFALTE